MTTYVYEQTEVVKTGRKATRSLRSGKIDTKWEITPANPTVGGWKKWVDDSELLTVEVEEPSDE